MRRFTRVMVVQLFLVPPYLAVQFVHQFIHSGRQVVPDGLGVQAPLTQVHRGFGSVFRLLGRQNAVDLRHSAEMSLNSFELVACVFSGSGV